MNDIIMFIHASYPTEEIKEKARERERYTLRKRKFVKTTEV